MPTRSQRRVAAQSGDQLTRLGATVETLQRENEHLRLEKAEAERLAAQRARWLAHVSHELRTPMNGILGMTQLALETDLSAEQRRHLEVVWRSADSLLTLVNDILDHSKIDHGKITIEHVPFRLDDLIGDSLKALTPSARDRVELGFEVHPAIPKHVVGDPGRLRQVIVNLVGNAIKFTHRGMVRLLVSLDSMSQNSMVMHFRVEDTGIGIAKDQIATIFEPFEQADAPDGHDYGGTGLGLSITKQLVELMGGRIWVASELDRGTTFHFTIPTLIGRDTVSPGDRERGLSGLRVLVLTDSGINETHLLEVLDREHMAALVVHRFEEAAAYLHKAADSGRPYEVVVLDMQHNGLATAEQLLGAANIERAGVMLITPSGQRGDAIRCRALGVDAYLTGPVTADDLADAVRALAAGTPDLITRHWLRERRRPLRLLLADDSPTNRAIAVKMLNKRGHEVVAVPDGAAAVAAFGTDRFDAVLLDIEMPVMDGVTAARHIRSLERRGQRVPIVALTGHISPADKERFIAAGMDDLTPKPFQAEAVLTAIARAAAGAARQSVGS